VKKDEKGLVLDRKRKEKRNEEINSIPSKIFFEKVDVGNMGDRIN